MSRKDITLPYGEQPAKENSESERPAPSKTEEQAQGAKSESALRRPPEQRGLSTLTGGSGSFAEATETAKRGDAAEAAEAAASGSWQMPSDEESPPPSAQWHPNDSGNPSAKAAARRDQSPPPVASGNGVILTVGWIEQILDLSLGREIEIQVAGLGRDFKVELNERAIVDVLASLAAYVRENMPNGGTLTMQAAHIQLSDPDFADKLELALGRYVFLGLSHIARGAAVDSGVFREPAHARRGLQTVMKMIKSHKGSVTLNVNEGRVMGFSVYLPAPKD